MKRKPLKKAEFTGCGTCGTFPDLVLTDDTYFYPGSVHELTLTIDDKTHKFDCEDGMGLREVEGKYKDELSNCQFAELIHKTPLHDETWELNTEDRKWYLVNQGMGYA